MCTCAPDSPRWPGGRWASSGWTITCATSPITGTPMRARAGDSSGSGGDPEPGATLVQLLIHEGAGGEARHVAAEAAVQEGRLTRHVVAIALGAAGGVGGERGTRRT